MRRLTFVLAMLFLAIIVNAQDRKTAPAKVEKIEGVPVYVFSTPADDYEIVGKALKAGSIIKVSVNMSATVREKVQKMVIKALKRQEEGKVPNFDGIIFNLDNDKVQAVKFAEEGKHLNANPTKYKEVSIYMFSEPTSDYEVLATLDADYSIRAGNSVLIDKVESMLNRTLKKETAGEVEHFDAVIINPDDLSEKLIKFK